MPKRERYVPLSNWSIARGLGSLDATTRCTQSAHILRSRVHNANARICTLRCRYVVVSPMTVLHSLNDAAQRCSVAFRASDAEKILCHDDVIFAPDLFPDFVALYPCRMSPRHRTRAAAAPSPPGRRRRSAGTQHAAARRNHNRCKHPRPSLISRLSAHMSLRPRHRRSATASAPTVRSRC